MLNLNDLNFNSNQGYTNAYDSDEVSLETRQSSASNFADKTDVTPSSYQKSTKETTAEKLLYKQAHDNETMLKEISKSLIVQKPSAIEENVF